MSARLLWKAARRTAGAVLLAMTALAAPVPARSAGAQDTVPDRYRALYTTLATTLDAVRAYVESNQPETHAPLTFGAELLTANGNRGRALLDPAALPATFLNLDRLQQLGVQGVTIAVKYPLYTPNDPHFQDYRAYYQQVASEIHRRGMTLDVEATVLFAGTPFTDEPVSFAELSLERFEAEDRQMVQDIITDLAPDYLTILAEPSTDAALTGLPELNVPAGATAFVQYVLDGLDRGGTRVGAGSGTWEAPAFAQSFAANTSLDYLTLHMYPLGAATVRNALAMAGAAHQYGKRLVMDETWLYKATAQELGRGGVATAPDIFRRDAYSFFAPLDQEYLSDVVGLARILGVEYISPFWSNLFFAYLDYDPAYDALPFGQLAALVKRQQYAALLAGTFSPTGLAYAGLICAGTPGCSAPGGP